MEIKDAIRLLKTKKGQPSTDYQMCEALDAAISALKFKGNYDKFVEHVKAEGMRGREVEVRHSGRVFMVREVAQ